MLSMKQTEVQQDDNLDLEWEVLDRQLKTLRKRRDRLMELVCNSDDEEADDEQPLTMHTESSVWEENNLVKLLATNITGFQQCNHYHK